MMPLVRSHAAKAVSVVANGGGLRGSLASTITILAVLFISWTILGLL